MDKDFIDALNTYYSLKSQYEKNMTKEKNKIIKTDGLSWNEKRMEFRKLKQKCINCKRPVGSIFKTKFKHDEERHLIALCGDQTNPCPLNIDINIGYMVNMLDFIQSDEAEIAKYKKDIIKEKNDMLFGYTNSEEAVKRFDEIKDSISSIMSSYEYTLNLYLNIVDNKEKKEEKNKREAELFLDVNNFKKMISDYEKTQDVQFISDAIEVYINTILPTSNKVRNLKYAQSYVEYNEDDETYTLIQKPTTMEQLEWDLGESPQGVVKMKIGMDKFKFRKETKVETKPAIQPLRKPPLVKKLVIKESSSSEEDESSSSEEEEDEEEEEDIRPKITIQPNLLPDGKIAATEASRLNWKIDLLDKKLIATNPTSGKTYEVQAGI